ncbi:hypothetical protein Btru_018607 [Bulinus truncatus]|nr:hypothetical protein Btru_018607 [Bulinus truncatus]
MRTQREGEREGERGREREALREGARETLMRCFISKDKSVHTVDTDEVERSTTLARNTLPHDEQGLWGGVGGGVTVNRAKQTEADRKGQCAKSMTKTLKPYEPWIGKSQGPKWAVEPKEEEEKWPPLACGGKKCSPSGMIFRPR